MDFLNMRHLPASFNVQETAWYLGFSVHDIPYLTRVKLLKPTGDPGPKATKIYAQADLRPLSESSAWMRKAWSHVHRHNRDRSPKNQQNKKLPKRK